MDREQSVQHFLDLIKKSHRGKFKVYIGMIAGVGKSYRMLQDPMNYWTTEWMYNSAILRLTDVRERRH